MWGKYWPARFWGPHFWAKVGQSVVHVFDDTLPGFVVPDRRAQFAAPDRKTQFVVPDRKG